MWRLQGDLKTFLRATSGDSHSELAQTGNNGRLPPLSTAQRITMCGQVALGMEHIADRALTHRDLAARNILLSPSLHLKVRLSVCLSINLCCFPSTVVYGIGLIIVSSMHCHIAKIH